MGKYAVILAAALIVGCDQRSPMPLEGAESFDLLAGFGIGVSHKIIVDGVVKADVAADSALFFENRQHVEQMGVEVVFRNEQGAETGRLTSLTADFDTRSRIFIARGDVVLTTSGTQGNRRLETEELRYDIRSGEIATDHPVTVHEGGRTRPAASFRSDADFTTWEVVGP